MDKPKQDRSRHTPVKSFRPYPPEVWTQAQAIAHDRGETVTDVLNRALADYVRRHRPS